MRLYHISETSDIKEFIPKPSPRKKDKNLVWAISEDKLPNYLFPRDCRRVAIFPKQNSKAADIKKLIGRSKTNAVIAIEKKWVPVIKKTTLYKYEFNSRDFVLEDECAGYYVADKPQKPISITAIKNIFDELFKYNIELRISPCLWKIREEVIKSSLDFSIIRMRNATPPKGGIRNYYPLPKDIR